MNRNEKSSEPLFGDCKHVLIIGGGSDLVPMLRNVDKNIRTSVFCRPSILNFVYEIEKNNTVLIIKEEASIQEWIEYARSLHKVDPFDSVVSFAEIDQDKAAAISESLGLNYHSVSTVEWVHNKFQMRNRLRMTGVEDIPNKLVIYAEEINEFGNKYGYPLIVKPSKGRASVGVSIIQESEEIFEKMDYSIKSKIPRLEQSSLIVEPYLKGKEYSVEAISENGQHLILAIVEKYKHELNKVEIGHMVPAELDLNTYKEIENHIIKVLDALEIKFGVTHTEIMLTDKGPRVIETHVRLAGDDIPLLIKDSLGVDMMKYIVEQAAGYSIYDRLKQEIEKGKKTQKGAAIWFINTELEGKLCGIENIDQITKTVGVVEFIPSYEIGMYLEGLKSSYSRLGSIRTTAETPVKAINLAKDLADKVKISISNK
ncbi:ATP-grasp domain-containing protein [Lysinibacillus mangiferihumi]|uniref:ATP-grasp domain-containing protein n=1 Tax=Lysinibacillus mangiferihumi TaxID=1130819 RepID=A0A4U2YHU4_9BACI|nr:ATP-grasp domain-containing protein [Lysinibacillus mangiferihumi]TKI60055.1 ATP-grasp domain-containing protein [Lysinibacillus mangiferihumi]